MISPSSIIPALLHSIFCPAHIRSGTARRGTLQPTSRRPWRPLGQETDTGLNVQRFNPHPRGSCYRAPLPSGSPACDHWSRANTDKQNFFNFACSHNYATRCKRWGKRCFIMVRTSFLYGRRLYPKIPSPNTFLQVPWEVGLSSGSEFVDNPEEVHLLPSRAGELERAAITSCLHL